MLVYKRTQVILARRALSQLGSLSSHIISTAGTDTSFCNIRSFSSEPDRPFTLPSNEYKPKQSLGQNFMSDQNYVRKIVNVFSDDSEV